MKSSAKPKSLKRLMMIELPIMGFVLGAVLSLGLSFSRQKPSLSSPSSSSACEENSSVFGRLPKPVLSFTTICAQAVSLEPTLQTQLQPAVAISQGLDFLDTAAAYDQLRYNVSAQPPFFSSVTESRSPTLKQIVEGTLEHLAAKDYPTDVVSISLVDLTGNCCEYGQFQDQQPRYPASIVKLFWLVALYGQYEAGVLTPDVDLYADDEALMAHYSNNGASSRIVDVITQTESGEHLEDEELAHWVAARKRINTYFSQANYPDLNLAHKTFPIPDLGLDERTGRDLQLASPADVSIDLGVADRNTLSTFAVARLLYEIDTGQAISQEYSDRIKQHLKHSTDPAVWQFEAANAIEGFFGEYLPIETELYTKLGYTFDDGRQEAAIIASPDGQTRFILVVFANDPVFSDESSKIFPEIAQYVYGQMQQRRTEPSTTDKGLDRQ
jgi:hypothetical protein